MQSSARLVKRAQPEWDSSMASADVRAYHHARAPRDRPASALGSVLVRSPTGRCRCMLPAWATAPTYETSPAPGPRSAGAGEVAPSERVPAQTPPTRTRRAAPDRGDCRALPRGPRGTGDDPRAGSDGRPASRSAVGRGGTGCVGSRSNGSAAAGLGRSPVLTPVTSYSLRCLDPNVRAAEPCGDLGTSVPGWPASGSRAVVGAWRPGIARPSIGQGG